MITQRLSHGCHIREYGNVTIVIGGLQFRLILGTFALQAERFLYHITPAVTRGLGFFGFLCQTLGNGFECQGASEMTIIYGCPVSQ